MKDWNCLLNVNVFKFEMFYENDISRARRFYEWIEFAHKRFNSNIYTAAAAAAAAALF